MKHHFNEDRTESLNRLIPDLYNYKTVLYVGARSDRFDYGEDFKKAGCDITILEIHPSNVKHLEKLGYLVHQGDVRRWNALIKYDIVFWWHGPEHIEESELKETLSRLEQYARVAVVLGCPWGEFNQGAIHGNENEKHVSSLDFIMFEELGYDVECLGRKDVRGSNITAVKKI